MAKQSNFIRFISAFLAAIYLFSGTSVSYADTINNEMPETSSYYSYFSENQNANAPSSSVVANFSKSEKGSSLTEIHTKLGITLDSDNNWCEWTVVAPEDGIYNLNFDYFQQLGTGLDIQLQLMIDGKLPFSESNSFVLPRIWKNKDDNETEVDEFGNEIRPQQVEDPKWKNVWLSSAMGVSERPYYFKLTKGSHTVRINLLRENVSIANLLFANAPVPVDYDTYISKYDLAKDETNKLLYKIEGEAAFEKNSPILTKTYDVANANMSPKSDPAHIVLNSIGGNSTWTQNGQELSWIVGDDVKAGLYELQLRVKQDLEPGTSTYRKLLINNEVPFLQAQSIAFPYNDNWYIKTLGDDKPQLIYIKPGDVLTLQATTGKAAAVLSDVNQTVIDLTDLYRQIIVVTGVNPDVYRDYDIEGEIPTLVSDLVKQKDAVVKISNMIKELMGKSTSNTAILDQLAMMMSGFASKPSSLPENLGGFKALIDGVGAIIFSLNTQPLELDALYLKSPNTPGLKANKGFFQNLWFGIQRFLATFHSDKNSNKSNKTIEVWCMTGREQAQVISQLIKDDFTKNTGIRVKVNFAGDETTLYKAIMAGKGPDVALTLKTETPINLALRGQAVDLLSNGIVVSDEYKSEFFDSAFVPFEYKGGLYALPESQTFDVMFYRKDILKRLNLDVPKTWEDFLKTAKVLQNNHMVMGVLETDSETPGVSKSVTYFYDQLLQNDGKLFSVNNSETGFNSTIASDAFSKWVKLYRDYEFERTFDFVSMLRTGEMPIGISPYSTYTKIAATSPEIAGLWDIAPIPGTVSNGSINNTCISATTGCSMLKAALKHNKKDESLAFMKWWTSSKIQSQYSNSCEAFLGIAGRVFPANRVAFNQIGWTNDEKKVLLEQWGKSVAIPQVPGSYIIDRELTNAMRKVVEEKAEPNRTFAIYNNEINSELARKAEEFKNNH